MARGGGFGGGGFGGGGFRGGGFRGGGSSFRGGSSFGRSSRPFGRTGSHRSVSRPPSGRNYYGRHNYYNHYGGYWYRPWYQRHYWFWGYPYRPWYYSPIHIGGGFFLFILLLLFLIPMIGLFSVPYPGNNNGVVTYNDTQTLNFNEFWYEKEYLTSGDEITYTMQAQSPVTFLITDVPFQDFELLDKKSVGTVTDTFTVERNHDFKYIVFYLQEGDSYNYEFSVTNLKIIEFFISDGYELKKWNNWENSQSFDNYVGDQNQSGQFTAPHAQDWYLVWYNPDPSSDVEISTKVEVLASTFDYSFASVVIEETEYVEENTFAVPNEGSWYFIIYFDPFLNSNSQLDISFYIEFNTNTSDNDRWVDSRPIMFIILIVIIIVLFIAIRQRSSAKTHESKKKQADVISTTPTSTTSQISKQLPSSDMKKNSCHVCGTKYLESDVYCTDCGTKLTGRDYGIAKSTTPRGASNCTSCGYKLTSESMFCSNCGTQIK